jgi:DNA mismatch endonuclease (patch repair protein)
MRRVRSLDTSPELQVRKALWARGLRYRLYAKNLPGKPDLVFRRERVAVFIDGDFWHGNQWRLRGLRSLEEQFHDVSNSEYWVRKISRNVIRDEDATARLEYDGWHVIRLWESDLKSDLAGCVERVARAVNERRQGGRVGENVR